MGKGRHSVLGEIHTQVMERHPTSYIAKAGVSLDDKQESCDKRMGGGPTLMYAAEAVRAYEEFTADAAA